MKRKRSLKQTILVDMINEQQALKHKIYLISEQARELTTVRYHEEYKFMKFNILDSSKKENF